VKRALVIAGVLIAAGAGVFGWLRLRALRSEGPAPTAAEVQALVDERRRLQDELRAVLDQRDVLDFAKAPSGSILIGVPTRFVEELVDQMVRGIFSEVRLRLGGIKVHHEADVKAKVLFTQKVGHFILDVNIQEVEALLKPSQPQFTFGGNIIGVRLPVTVTDGRGRGTVRFRWQGKGLAGAVCGDMDVSPDVSSRVKPSTYTLVGEFQLAAEGEKLVAKPRLRPLKLKLMLEPTEATWATLASTVEAVEDDKNGICRMAIRKVDVSSIVRGVIRKGFNTTVPGDLVGPIALPASVEQTVELEGRQVTLGARPVGLHVTPRMIWYGAAMGAEVKR
jgi:hypothetical protein